MNALYRPGPMDYIPSFIARKNGKEKIQYDIPCMEKYLKDTYGITVYQEQVMLLSRQLANFTRGESDAIANNDINKLAVNSESLNNLDTHFSDKVESKGISNQRSSGRCWLFTGLNVLRARTIAKFGMGEFQFSQNYSFFWDQLEKANLFLQGIIDTREKPLDDKMVEWLFKNPVGDGGQYTGVSDLLMKYGVVPAEVMVETNSSNNTYFLLEFK